MLSHGPLHAPLAPALPLSAARARRESPGPKEEGLGQLGTGAGGLGLQVHLNVFTQKQGIDRIHFQQQGDN